MFALGVALVALAIAKAARLPAVRTALIALVVVSSHALLDTLTDGGLGCALLWPFSDERFFAPWTPLPVAPIGRAYLSGEGLRVAAVELVALAPVLAYALWPAGDSISTVERTRRVRDASRDALVLPSGLASAVRHSEERGDRLSFAGMPATAHVSLLEALCGRTAARRQSRDADLRARLARRGDVQAGGIRSADAARSR